MKKRGATLFKRISAAAGVFCLLLGLAFPVQAMAESQGVHDIDIVVELNDDGSATVTEVWDLTVTDGTEWYIQKPNIDEQVISAFTVTDETGRQFEDVGRWDTDGSRQQKAGKSGLVETNGGYELCWGFGEYGRHTYTLRYHITNMVKAYTDRDAIYSTFVPFDSNAQHVKITIRKEGVVLDSSTGVWAFGYTGEINVVNGEVVAESTSPLRGSRSYAAILVDLPKGIVTPQVTRNRNFEALYEEAIEGSNYGSGGGNGGGNGGGGSWSSFSGIVRSITSVIFPIITVAVVFGLIGASRRKSGTASGGSTMKPEYKNPEYSRELPFGNSLPATYTRLSELKQLANEGDIIGAYLLKWVRTRQVDIVQEQGGFFGSKVEDAIKLYDVPETMQGVERTLYQMLVSAAGRDWILQSKEFEKWSRKNYSKVEGWFEQYKNLGKSQMRQLGAVTEVDTKILGFIPSRKTVYTEQGEALTRSMFGFKKYLEDFTIINEREAREVQLWDEYLIFAQVFGIADKVAEQFKKLYPDYFVQISNQLGYGIDIYDVIVLHHITRNYGRAMYSGYRSGYNAAHTDRSSGGGGFSSSGGGGFSSSGFGGSTGSR